MFKFLISIFPLFLSFAAGAPPIGGGGAPAAPAGGSGGGAGTGGDGGAGTEPTLGWAGDEGGGADEGTGDDRTAGQETETGTEGEFDDFGSEHADENDNAGTPKSLKEFVDSITNGLHSEDPNIKHAAEKELKKVYSERQRYQQQFKTPEDARAFTEKVEILGGIDGIEAEQTATNQFLEGWKAGDEKVISQWMQDNADGLQKSMPAVSKLWRENDMPGWQHHMASIFMSTWKDPGEQGVSALAAWNSISKMAGIEKIPGFAEAFNRISEVINAVNENTKQNPARDLSPERQKLDQDRKSVEQQKAQIADEKLNAKIMPVMNTSARKALASVTKGRKFAAEQQKQLLSDVIEEFSKMSKKDETFQKNAKALKAAGETEKFEKLAASRFERFMPLAARNVWRKYAGIGGLSDTQKQQRQADASSRKESGAGSAGGNSIRTNMPQTYADTQNIDWDRMSGMAKSHGVTDAQSMFQDKHLFYKKGDKRLYSF